MVGANRAGHGVDGRDIGLKGRRQVVTVETAKYGTTVMSVAVFVGVAASEHINMRWECS